MSDGLLYLDSSAIVKLVLPEPETPALFDLIESYPERVTSALATVEVLRAARRSATGEAVIQRAEQVLARLGLIKIDPEVLKSAASPGPRELGPLDAIHLATALSLGDQLGGMAAYDTRLKEAAEATGVEILTPG